MKKSLLILILSLLPVNSRAEKSRGSQSLAIIGAGPFYSGIKGGLQYAYSPQKTPLLSFGAEFMQIPDLYGGDTKALMLLAEMRLQRPKGIWRPYLFGGVGGHYTHRRVVDGPWGNLNPFPNSWPDTGTLESRTLIDDSDTSWAAAWGMGVEAFITDHIFIGSELRDTVLGPTHYHVTEAGQLIGAQTSYSTLHQFGLMFRVGFKWGGT